MWSVGKGEIVPVAGRNSSMPTAVVLGEGGVVVTTHRTLIIGLDGATFDLVTPWAEAGYLPTLARLMAEGVHGPLKAWPNMNSAAAWSSMITGYNPGQHGIFSFNNAPGRGDGGWRPVTALDRQKDPFWRLLSRAGESVGVVNVPISYPADAVSGFMISGMDAPGTHSSGVCHPAELLGELRSEGIDYVLEAPDPSDERQRAQGILPDEVRQMVDARARAVLHLMKSRRWNTFMAVFVAPDRMQHHFWPAENASLEDDAWAPIRETYRLIDTHLGTIVAEAGDETTVLVVSDHGFGPARPVRHHLNRLLADLGYVRFRQGTGRLRGRMLEAALAAGRRLVPQRLRFHLAHALSGFVSKARAEHRYPGIDWSRTRVAATSSGGGVQVNTVERRASGTVPAAEYLAVRDEIRDVLSRLVDPATGRSLVRSVHRREDLYRGPYADQAADLVIEWDFESLGQALCHESGGRRVIVEAQPGKVSRRKVSGDHRPYGVLIAHGAEIRHGAEVDDAKLYDIAPTVLHLRGQPIPADMDGRVLSAVFTDEFLTRNPVRFTEPSSETDDSLTGPGLGEQDTKVIEDRLRSLGYLD